VTLLPTASSARARQFLGQPLGQANAIAIARTG